MPSELAKDRDKTFEEMDMEIKNPFIQDPKYIAFITGYVIGVLGKLLYKDVADTVESTSIENGVRYKIEV
jgi:hypothetical protein